MDGPPLRRGAHLLPQLGEPVAHRRSLRQPRCAILDQGREGSLGPRHRHPRGSSDRPGDLCRGTG
eukprot:4631483-Lingulodinium_polyedra.AAC.1